MAKRGNTAQTNLNAKKPKKNVKKLKSAGKLFRKAFVVTVKKPYR